MTTSKQGGGTEARLLVPSFTVEPGTALGGDAAVALREGRSTCERARRRLAVKAISGERAGRISALLA